MASDDVLDHNPYSCINDPNFTIICVFLDKFADACGIIKPNIKELCLMLEDNKEVAPALEEMHIKLLRKIKKNVPTGKWENTLAKFAHTYSNQDAWEIERFGYKNSSLAVKLRILKALLETQFDRNVKFKGHINGIAAEELRSEPLGKDKFGNLYWCILDTQCNIRIFRENLDDETWILVASNREQLVNLIEKLKLNEIDATSVQDILFEDTSSSTSLHSEKELRLKQDAKETSLILDRRVYKKETTEIGGTISAKAELSATKDNDELAPEKKDVNPEEHRITDEDVVGKNNLKPTIVSTQNCEVKESSTNSEEAVTTDIDIKAAKTTGTDVEGPTVVGSEKQTVATPDDNMDVAAVVVKEEQPTAITDDNTDIAVIAVKEVQTAVFPVEEMDVSVDAVEEDHTSATTSDEKMEIVPRADKMKNTATVDVEAQTLALADDKPEAVTDADKMEIVAAADAGAQSIATPNDKIEVAANTDKELSKGDDDKSCEVSEAVEEPTMLVTGEGSGTDCETQPIFSDVIEECTLYVYGQGSGADNDMGNIKIGDSNASTSKSKTDGKRTESMKSSNEKPKPSLMSKNGQEKLQTPPVRSTYRITKHLPLKKKINKDYSFGALNLSLDAENRKKIVPKTPKKIKINQEMVASKTTEQTETVSSKASSYASDDSSLSQQSEDTSPPLKAKLVIKDDSIERQQNASGNTEIPKKCNLDDSGDEHSHNDSKDKEDLRTGKSDDKIQENKENVSNKDNTECTGEVQPSESTIKSVESIKKKSEESTTDVTKEGIDTDYTVSDQKSEHDASQDSVKKIPEKDEKVIQNDTKTAVSNDDESKKAGRRGRRPRSGMVDGLDISHVIIDKSENGSPPVRQSRRIAQQKIREETNRRLIEEQMLREMKAEAIKKKKKIGLPQSEDEEYVMSEDDDEDSKNTESKVKKKKSDKPWMTSSDESSSESEPEDDFIEQERSECQSSLKSDHEFSPESDLESEFAVPTKRARTVRAEKHTDRDEDDDSVDSNLDHACQNCGKTDHPEWILLCDSCDKGYHCSCLVPVLFIIPEGDWFCPVCQHEMLITKLQVKLGQFDEYSKQLDLDNERIKQQHIIEANNRSGSTKPDDGMRKRKYESNDHEKDGETGRPREKDGNESSSSSSEQNSNEKHSDASETDEDDTPIYKLRRRNQTIMDYRFNDYDDLINSAINRSAAESMEQAPRGKDIRNIVEAEKKETERRSSSNSPVVEKKISQKTASSKKKKRLNNLDISSEEDDGSDEDFKGAVSTSDDESVSMTEESESSLEMYTSRRSRAAAKKKYDMTFINDDDDDSDKSTYNIRKRPPKAKKVLDDSDEFDEEDLTESEEIDSEELCNDTETDSSQDSWKKRKNQTKIIKRLPNKNPNTSRKKKTKKDDDKSYRSGVKKRPTKLESDSDSSEQEDKSNDTGKRRTRGKKLHYILDDDFESSDDGITPGVQRPDTPPEERERFIKKQEEIKRMLAEKNTAAAKELATPKIKPLTETIDKNKQTPLSTIPPQVIEGAKVLDIDFLKSSKNTDSDDFDEALAVNFSDPDDVNEDELAKIMEDEDFAQHQLKLEDEEILRNKCTVENSPKKKARDFESIDPSQIAKADKKTAGQVTPDKRYREEAANRSVAAALEPPLKFALHPPPRIREGDPPNYIPPLLTYHNVIPPPQVTNTTSLLQQMKQQAIPLHDPHDPIKLVQPPPLPSANSYTSSVVPVPPETTAVTPINPINLAPGASVEPKPGTDVRRRRRKKITPLRGDLYKMMENRSSLESSPQLHYHLTSVPASNVLPENASSTYAQQKPHNSMPPGAPAFISSSPKLDQIGLRFTTPNPYVPPTNYPHGVCHAPSNSTVPSPLTNNLSEQPSTHRAFITLEPVNTEEPPTEQATDVAENTENNQVDSESTSEFSGLVSYFSSQQNELNA